MRTPSGTVIALCFTAFLAFSREASPQPRESPQELYLQGVAAFQVRDLDTALNRFQRAYVLSRRPELLMNVGMTFQAAERRPEALVAYRQFLSVSPDAPNRAEVLARIAQIERELAARTPPAPPPAAVVPPPPPRTPAPVAPVAPAVLPAAPPVWPWVTLGAGALVAVAGALLFALPSDPGADPTIDNEQGYLDARGRRTTLQVTGATLGALGLTTAIVGAVGLALRPRARAPRARWNLHVAPLAGGGLVGVSHAF